MVGLVVPIHLEGGDSTSRPATRDFAASRLKSRNGSDAALRKPLRKKNSRQKLRTFNIEIQLEGGSRDDRNKTQSVQSTPVPADTTRKIGISNKGSSVSVRLPSNKVVPRRGSSRDLLRGAVTRRQSSKDLRNVLMKRQSSRDMVNGGPKNVTKDPRICLIKRQSSQDLCNDRFTIRRDSINGLRIVSRESESESESDTIQRLGDINISDDKREFTKFQLESLRTHNQYRSKHRAPAMALDAELCKRAAEYADFLAKTDTFEHSGDEENGENLYWSWSSDPRWVVEGDEPVRSWYDECRGYNYSREPRDTESGHFTQLVWDSSTQLGVGVTRSESTGKFYVVMKYWPPGNYIGKYTQHVKPPAQ